MKKWIYLQLKLCCLSFVILKTASAQTAGADTGVYQAALGKANSVYTVSIGAQLPLNNGPEYSFYNPLEIRGSAYFMELPFTPGDVYYDGAGYKGVQLLYDLYKDEVAALLYDHFTKYILIKSRVASFDLAGHHFINISPDSLPANTVLKGGYYDELYHGRTQVITKRYKVIQNYQSNGGIMEAYNFFTDVKEVFYIRRGGVYYPVSGQGGALDVLQDRKKELRQYIKLNKLKFGQDPHGVLASIAAYYDRITN
jgi:hypothetical protein